MAAVIASSLLLVFLLPQHVLLASPYRLCAMDRVNLQNRCQMVMNGDSQVQCVNVTDSVDCALKIQQGLADFGVFTAEEALLASSFVGNSVQVIADIRHIERLKDPFAFQAVVVVRKSYGGTLDSLKGSNFCHPGFDTGQLWTDAVLKHFERSVAETACVENISIMEMETKALSVFFNSSCRPGPWVQDDVLDNHLKSKYTKLCDLCDSPKTCSYSAHEAGTHTAALTCLTHRGGNVTYVALRYVREYFGLEPGFTSLAKINDFQFLTPDGTTESLDTPSPQAWLQQPWSAVVARRDIAVALQPLLLVWLNTSTSDPRPMWQEALSELMLEPDHAIHNASYLLSNSTRHRNDTAQSCGSSMKWCTTSQAELRKCEWLQAAVQTHGLRPSLDCVIADNKWSCWSKVRDNSASVVTEDTEYGYVARQSYSLSPVAYLESGYKSNYQIIAIISSYSSNVINSWSDVSQKKACFPEFGGLAWISAVSTLVDNNQLAKICPYAQAMGNYFSGGCAPGAKDPDHTRGSGAVPANLCSICSTHNSSDSCSTTSSSVFYGDLGALRCLSSGFGDIAFVDFRQLVDSAGVLSQDIDPSVYRVLCRNGSLATTVGLTVDNGCALAHGVGSEIMGRADRTETRNQELTELFLQMDRWFGSSSPSKGESVFHMYNEFQGVKDLLFKDSTVGLILPSDSGYSNVESYKKLQEDNSVCKKNRNTGVPLLPSLIVLLAVFMGPFVF